MAGTCSGEGSHGGTGVQLGPKRPAERQRLASKWPPVVILSQVSGGPPAGAGVCVCVCESEFLPSGCTPFPSREIELMIARSYPGRCYVGCWM